jgi:uncharacterized ion transporter superfamily protein YfcC
LVVIEIVGTWNWMIEECVADKIVLIRVITTQEYDRQCPYYVIFISTCCPTWSSVYELALNVIPSS